MSVYAPGDLIRLVNPDGPMSAALGATAIVTGNRGKYVLVQWVQNDLSGTQMDGAYHPSSFELVGENTTPHHGPFPPPSIRQFDSGATRDIDTDKLDYEAFYSPLVVQKYAEYMHGKRKMADGSLRDGDNWQKGIPLDAYAKSEWRHHMDFWAHHRGLPDLAVEDLENTLCAMLFNISGYLHEVLKAKRTAAP